MQGKTFYYVGIDIGLNFGVAGPVFELSAVAASGNGLIPYVLAFVFAVAVGVEIGAPIAIYR